MPRSAPIFLTARAVADLLGLSSPAAFLHRRDKMAGEQLFPPPMPHIRRPMLWKAEEVQAWIDRQGRALPPGHPPVDPALIASGVAAGKVLLMEKARTA